MTSANDAINLLRPDDLVIVGHCEPQTLLREICAQRERLKGLELLVSPITTDPIYLRKENVRYFRVRSVNGTAFRLLRASSRTEAKSDAAVRPDAVDIEYVPGHTSSINNRFTAAPGRRLVVLLHTAAPDRDGFSLGVSADYAYALANRADLVIAEANALMPRMPGPNAIPAEKVTCYVPSEEQFELHIDERSPDDVDLAIGAHVARIVPNGATVEVGIGGGGASIWRALRSHRRLGIHTGLITGHALEAMQSGVVTNECKPVKTGISVAAIVMGSPDFLATVQRMKNIEVCPTEYTHNLQVIAAIPNFYAINSCIRIDIWGHVYSETLDGHVIGATLGLVDFARGAAISPGGRSILIVRATNGRERRSNILDQRPPGDLVTLTHSDLDVVVSEYGVAEVRGLSITARAEALAGIARPEDRARLLETVRLSRSDRW